MALVSWVALTCIQILPEHPDTANSLGNLAMRVIIHHMNNTSKHTATTWVVTERP